MKTLAFVYLMLAAVLVISLLTKQTHTEIKLKQLRRSILRHPYVSIVCMLIVSRVLLLLLAVICTGSTENITAVIAEKLSGADSEHYLRIDSSVMSRTILITRI